MPVRVGIPARPEAPRRRAEPARRLRDHRRSVGGDVAADAADPVVGDMPFTSARRASRLDGDQTVDVAIVGAGYTGCGRRCRLLEADPRLRVIVVERHHVGFGASGRNGGWCSALLPVSLAALEPDATGARRPIAWQRAMIDTVDEVGRLRPRAPRPAATSQLARAERSRVARNASAARRGSSRRSPKRGGSGSAEADVRLLDAAEAAARDPRRRRPRRPCSRRTAPRSTRCGSPTRSPRRRPGRVPASSKESTSSRSHHAG